MEFGLSKAITIIALTCFLVAGAAVTSILSRESMSAPAAEPAPVVRSPVANRESKQDRLSVMSLASAALPAASDATPTEVLRQAYASSSAADIEAAKAVRALPRVAALAPQSEPQQTGALPQAAPDAGALPPVNVQAAKPKVVAKPAPQKSYALLSDVQIAGIKERLKLSSSQEYYWPSVETALHAVARKLNAAKLSNPHAGAAQLDPDCEEVQQLKSAAMPLLFQLREDQKEEVRKLARIIGLEKVAAAI
jgi:ABC-type transporter Mla MlaB component